MRTGRFGPEIEPAGGDEPGLGEVADGLAGVEAEGEEGAHEAGEDGDGDALAEVVIAFAGLELLFRGDLVFLGVTGGAVDGDADEADEDSEEDDLAGGLVEEGHDLAVVDGRDQGPEEGAEAESDGVTERDAQIADGEAEGDSADSPEHAEEEGIADVCGVGDVGRGAGLTVGVRDEDGGQHRRRDDPGGEALDEPVHLPRPALDPAEWDEVGGGAEAANPVKDNAEKWIRSHSASLLAKVYDSVAYHPT